MVSIASARRRIVARPQKPGSPTPKLIRQRRPRRPPRRPEPKCALGRPSPSAPITICEMAHQRPCGLMDKALVFTWPPAFWGEGLGDNQKSQARLLAAVQTGSRSSCPCPLLRKAQRQVQVSGPGPAPVLVQVRFASKALVRALQEGKLDLDQDLVQDPFGLTFRKGQGNLDLDQALVQAHFGLTFRRDKARSDRDLDLDRGSFGLTLSESTRQSRPRPRPGPGSLRPYRPKGQGQVGPRP